ncbi:MAG: glycolate oxidase subunit GlcF [gamma proteobacterium symbiont of Bathyaustriella thionipta]|nr:glycolate oxidase subunit GlcF [gamma proteobacterium symbiont of Bathyaustriella thionipta]MCU7949416.1 glycolate oxidase subunit GlcF [gamma proteobacterium symbiont of Bathyaustriella thionipta]MCU7953090.1 glycolate oxidase subunit GlcF [gamma proteobacterium symbiont of Bathyaustriella thionipta]MCU7956003.1 glycolate oxidase subunit GlcF [gamma proteobacterium symbiont of Bathyaustriella thionipta]MCU7968954.1 glycolate oxidase subunit GlcF [gamma proteobacterium symbiont of Bathyaustr
MKTNIHEQFKTNPDINEAEAILRSCVHCGFCTATCPTYQQLFDERDGPRGRIYLIKQLLEGGEVTELTRTHLDRCLTCRSCETTCPSGVQYGRLLDIGRAVLEEKLPRNTTQQLIRWLLRQVLPYKRRFGPLLKLGQLFRPILPGSIKKKIPNRQKPLAWPVNSHERVMLTLEGCAQPGATPNTHIASARVLDKLGITLVTAPSAGCCGAVDYHLSAQEQGLNSFKRNIDAWWPAIEQGAEAIVITASGCGAMVKEYGHLLSADPEYAAKALRVSELAKDLSEVLMAEDLSTLKTSLNSNPDTKKLAFHCPCTLQHAQQLSGVVESILQELGFDLAQTREKHICCGSSGTYSILQPKMSQQLLKNKLSALSIDNPSQIATANIGCQLHLATQSEVPVYHWIELVDRACQ